MKSWVEVASVCRQRAGFGCSSLGRLVPGSVEIAAVSSPTNGLLTEFRQQKTACFTHCSPWSPRLCQFNQTTRGENMFCISVLWLRIKQFVSYRLVVTYYETRECHLDLERKRLHGVLYFRLQTTVLCNKCCDVGSCSLCSLLCWPKIGNNLKDFTE